MPTSQNKQPNIALELIEQRIYLIRGQKVMPDSDLAALYNVSTKILNQAVKRNLLRFPEDFMFQLFDDEVETLRSQFVTSNTGRGGRRYAPFAFTEQGVAMLSSVLNSERAIQVNIAIMRAFVRMRSILAAHKELARKIEALEKNTKANFAEVFKFINAYLISKRQLPSAIGFHVGKRK